MLGNEQVNSYIAVMNRVDGWLWWETRAKSNSFTMKLQSLFWFAWKTKPPHQKWIVYRP